MSKLKLIIADKDKAYVESISNYIINNYSNRFQVVSFTEDQYLLDYFSKHKENVDILLICSEWYIDLIPKDRVCTPIILSEGILTDKEIDCEVINKYQRGDKLVSSIINCFVEKNPNKYYVSDSKKETKVIAVYSPIGGIGKTSIAVGCSVKVAEDSKSVFYLNLENIQSTSEFFDCEGSKNFSNILYYIKSQKKNIALKIEGIRSRDSEYNIYYFSPPDSSMDLNETSMDEINYLVNQLKISNNYDYIFIDMTSIFDEKSISILRDSDQVILILGQDDLSRIKLNLFIKELDIFSKRNNLDISDKITIVLNKYRQDKGVQINDLDICDNSTYIKVPYIYEPISVNKDNYTKRIKNEFKNAIAEILTRI